MCISIISLGPGQTIATNHYNDIFVAWQEVRHKRKETVKVSVSEREINQPKWSKIDFSFQYQQAIQVEGHENWTMINWRTLSWSVAKFSRAICKEMYGDWWGDLIFWPQGWEWNEAKQYSLVYGPSLAGPNYSLKKQSSVFVLGFPLPPLRPCPRWSGEEKDPKRVSHRINVLKFHMFGSCAVRWGILQMTNVTWREPA